MGAGMNAADIQAELARKFERGPVVVWNDPAGQFSDVLEGLDLPGVDMVRERDGERFELKYLLNGDLKGRHVLLYRAGECGGPDWFADAAVFGQAFSADLAETQLGALHAADTPAMREALRRFAPFLRKKTAMRRLTQLKAAYGEPRELAVAVMAASLGRNVPADADDVITAYLVSALNERRSGKAPWELLDGAGALDTLRDMVADCTGFLGDVEDASALARHILLSTLGDSGASSVLDGLGALCSPGHAARCLEIALAWVRGTEADDDARAQLLRAVRDTEDACGLGIRFARVPVSALLGVTMFPVADEVILTHWLDAVERGDDCVDEVLQAVAARRSAPWYGCMEPFYNCLRSAAGIMRFQRIHASGFFKASSRAVWDAYTSEWYEMDAGYRRFHAAFSRAIAEGRDVLDDAVRRVAGRVENVYKNWYLSELSTAWMRVSESEFASRGYAEGIPRQLDFYLAEVDGIARGKTTAWVIVSDALRYEVAAELAQRIERETRGRAVIKGVQAVFPSVTECGMPALLPHAVYRMDAGRGGSGLQVTVDGAQVPGTSERQAVIQGYLDANQPGARGVALRADDFVAMSMAERKEAVKDAAVVYLYHNQIDAIGDKPVTEDEVFKACDETIDELTNLVSLIAGKFRATDVLVTADHGFLYTYQPLAATEKLGKDEVCGTVIQAGKRYIVGGAGMHSDVMVSVALGTLSDGRLAGLAPRSCVRIKQAGGGENYVHGGLSLQELCVPVVHFRNSRAGARNYVEARYAGLELVSSLMAIHNRTLELEMLQGEPVAGKVLPAEYELFLRAADGSKLSDAARVTLDSADEDASRRVLRVQLHLKSSVAARNGQMCELVAQRVAPGERGDETVLRQLRLQVAFAGFDGSGW